MQRKNRLFELERRFIHLMAELLRLPSEREKQRACEKMRADLHDAALAPGARVLLQTFDLEAWLDSKIHGTTFAEAVRAKWERARPVVGE
jgi:hypothetical protein